VISRQATNYLKGIALVLVLIGHCVPPFFPFNEIYVPIKRFLSQVGVNLFLILSGYGVAYTYLRTNTKPVFFLRRRIIRLWPIYVLAMAFYALISISVFQETVTIKALLTNLLWVQYFFNTQNEIYSASHFFSALLTAYLISSLTMFGRNYKQYIAIYIASLSFFQIFCFLYYSRFLFPDYLASFSFGILLILFEKEKNINLYNYVFIIISYIYCFSDYDDILTATSGVLVFFIGLEFLKINSLTRLNRSFIVLGSVSYIVYLGHNYFLWKWPDILALTDSILLTGAIILGATGIWLFFLFWSNNHLNKRVLAPLLDRQNE
jgi:peptidoglycan/LPS O-acetylase OafA/YrhL